MSDDWKLLNTSTASGASSVSFTELTGYKIFKWVWINCHPSIQDAAFQFQVNASGQTGYNETITSTTFNARHSESDATADLLYRTDTDQAQGTSFQTISVDQNFDNDECTSGELFLFNPQSTVFVKHFYATANGIQNTPLFNNLRTAGYINTTAAITELSLKFSSGNVDDGTIKQYGLVAT